MTVFIPRTHVWGSVTRAINCGAKYSESRVLGPLFLAKGASRMGKDKCILVFGSEVPLPYGRGSVFSCGDGSGTAVLIDSSTVLRFAQDDRGNLEFRM